MSTAAPAVASYQIDSAHSHAQFKVRHMMIANVRGEFTKVSGTVKYDPSNPAASIVEATIDATTISTRDPDRDNHLKSPDFLDVVKNPTIRFKSKKVTASNVNSFEVVGDLTIHRSYERSNTEGRRPDAGSERSMGQYAPRPDGDDQNQSERFRTRMERGA